MTDKKKKQLIALLILLVALIIILVIVIKTTFNNSKETPTTEENTSETTTTKEVTTEEPTTEEPTTEEPTTEWSVTISDVTITCNDTQAILNGRTIDDLQDLKDKLAMLPVLNYVEMCGCNVSNEQMEELIAEFPNIKFVWEVALKEHGKIRTDCLAFSTLNNGTTTYRLNNDDAKVFKYCTEMRILDIGHNAITDFSFLQYMPELRILIIADDLNPQDPAYYRITDISGLQYCKNLRYLELFLNQITDISALSGLENLIDLNICHNNISDIEPLMNMPKLERLYIKYNKISVADYNRLKERYPNTKIVYTGDFESSGDAWRTDANDVKHPRYALMREIIEECHGLTQCTLPDVPGQNILEKHNFYEVFY